MLEFRRFRSTGQWLFLVAVTAAILWYCSHFSRGRIMWGDEVFSWDVLNDSWSHMFYALRQGADSGGLGFYVLCRLWLKLFGTSVLTLRLSCAMGCAVGFAFVFLATKRYYNVVIAGGVLITVWMKSDVVLWQMVQGRFYGWLLAACGAVFYFAARLSEERYSTGREPGWLLACYGTSSLLLVMLHPMGVVVSGCILIGAIATDLKQRMFRLWMYSLTAFSWLGLLLELDQIRAQKEFAKPWFWTTKPTLNDLTEFWIPSGRSMRSLLAVPHHIFLFTIMLAFVFAFVHVWHSHKLIPCLNVLGPAIGLTLMPFAVFLYSRVADISLFVDRYLICYVIGIAVLCMQALQTIAGEDQHRLWRLVLVKVMILIMVIYALKNALFLYPKQLALPPYDFTVRLGQFVSRGLPVVIVRPDIFIMMTADNHGPAIDPIYPMDLQLASDPEAPRGLVSGYHEMAAWKLVGYNAANIVEGKQFLAETNSFIVLEDPGIPWAERRVMPDPQWLVTPMGEIELLGGMENVFMVKRK